MRQRLVRLEAESRGRAPDDVRRGRVALVDPTLGCDTTFGSVSNDVVLIVALTPTRRLLFVSTLAGIAPAGLELPAGFVDAGEPLPLAAARELYAETGYTGTTVWREDRPTRALRTAGGGAFRVCLVTAARPDRTAPGATPNGRSLWEVALPEVYAPTFLAALRVPGTRHALDLLRQDLDDSWGQGSGETTLVAGPLPPGAGSQRPLSKRS